MALNKAKIITVTSVKGGTGKTTTTLNIAGVLTLMKKKTLLLDLDLYSGVIGASLNIKTNTDIYTLCEDMMNNRFKQIEDYVTKYDEYLDVLSAPIDPRSVSKISTKFLDTLFRRLTLKYEVILIDTNHIIDKTNLIAFDYSDYILQVMTNDLMDIKNMKTMLTIYKDMDQTNYKIILNEAKLTNYNYTLSDVEATLEEKIDYVIPKNFYNKNIEKYIYNGQIMTLDNNVLNTKGGKTIQKLTQDLFEE